MYRPVLRVVCLSAVLGVLAVPAMALNVVNTSKPAVNYLFSTSGICYVTDMTSDLLNGGKLQSRIYQAQPGSPAYPNWVYEYRVNLTNAVGILDIQGVSSVTIYTGPMVQYDFNFDSVATDHVFVTTVGGIGTKGLSSANAFWWGSRVFNFSSTIWQGGSPGTGESSYFFGYVSPYAPVVGTIYVQTTNGQLTLSGYVPNY
jgi:hypothetical protein